jgi:hypothetical protein
VIDSVLLSEPDHSSLTVRSWTPATLRSQNCHNASAFTMMRGRCHSAYPDATEQFEATIGVAQQFTSGLTEIGVITFVNSTPAGTASIMRSTILEHLAWKKLSDSAILGGMAERIIMYCIKITLTR